MYLNLRKNGGGGGNRTRVLNISLKGFISLVSDFSPPRQGYLLLTSTEPEGSYLRAISNALDLLITLRKSKGVGLFCFLARPPQGRGL